MGCCKPVLHGWFVHESLYKLGVRHTPDCRVQPGVIEGIVKGAWWSQGRRLRTGEAYR